MLLLLSMVNYYLLLWLQLVTSFSVPLSLSSSSPSRRGKTTVSSSLSLSLSLSLLDHQSDPARNRPVVTRYILTRRTTTTANTNNDNSNSTSASSIVATCCELEPLNDVNEDAVDEWYPTARRIFWFPNNNNDNDNHNHNTKNDSGSVVTVRRTSFACSKMGYTVWPSSLTLCLDAVGSHQHNNNNNHNNNNQNNQTRQKCKRRVLELGAGVGLPSVVYHHILSAPAVLATDFWYKNDMATTNTTDQQQQQQQQRDSKRLIPEHWHGMNLRYNLLQLNKNHYRRPTPTATTTTPTAQVCHLDWHDPNQVVAIRQTFQPTLILGSDIIYYPDDLPHLCRTLELLLGEVDQDKKKKKKKDTTTVSPEIVLVSPLLPEQREALPAFRAWLQDKQQRHDWNVAYDTLTLHHHEIGQDSQDFVKMSIRPPPAAVPAAQPQEEEEEEDY